MTVNARRILVVGDQIIKVAVSDEVQAAIEGWSRAHIDTLRDALAPLDVAPEDILIPTYERVVFADQVEPAPTGG